MKRFMLFAGDSYYADGGAIDFKGDFDTWQAAVMTAREAPLPFGWWHVYDTVNRKVTHRRDGANSGQVPNELLLHPES